MSEGEHGAPAGGSKMRGAKREETQQRRVNGKQRGQRIQPENRGKRKTMGLLSGPAGGVNSEGIRPGPSTQRGIAPRKRFVIFDTVQGGTFRPN